VMGTVGVRYCLPMQTRGGSFGCMRSPYASVVASRIAWRKAEHMVVSLETCHLLAGVGMESRWESRNMVADLWGVRD
jgi:hypothetical protein